MGHTAGAKTHNPTGTWFLNWFFSWALQKHTNMDKIPQTEIFTVSTAGIVGFFSPKSCLSLYKTSIPGLGRSLEEGMATHSSILAWRIPSTVEPGGYSPWDHKVSDMTERLSTAQNQVTVMQCENHCFKISICSHQSPDWKPSVACHCPYNKDQVLQYHLL